MDGKAHGSLSARVNQDRRCQQSPATFNNCLESRGSRPVSLREQRATEWVRLSKSDWWLAVSALLSKRRPGSCKPHSAKAVAHGSKACEILDFLQSCAVPDQPDIGSSSLREPAKQACLANPPIVEASIDFRAALPKTFDLSQVRSLAKQLEAQFPILEEQRGVQQQFNFKFDPSTPLAEAAAPSVTDLGLQAIRLRSKDGKTVVVFRPNGMALVQLQPYTSWDVIRQEALRIWILFKQIAQPTEVSQVNVRYLNRIDFPLAQFDFDDFLTGAPRVPRPLPDILVGFFTRILVPVDPASVMISQALEVSPATGKFSVIIDLVASHPLPLNVANQAALEEVLVNLRKIKNDAFFGLLTQRAVDLFQ